MQETLEAVPEENRNEKLEKEILGMRESITGFLLAEGCNENDVEDIVQQTLAKAVLKIDTFRGESLLKTWVFTIARRLFLDLERKSYRKKEVPLGILNNNPDFDEEDRYESSKKSNGVLHEDPRDITIKKEESELLKKAIDILDEPLRSMLIDRGNEESYEELAQKYKVPVGTVMSRLHTARKKLASILELMKISDEVK